jgi:hypothetical protein
MAKSKARKLKAKGSQKKRTKLATLSRKKNKVKVSKKAMTKKSGAKKSGAKKASARKAMPTPKQVLAPKLAPAPQSPLQVGTAPTFSSTALNPAPGAYRSPFTPPSGPRNDENK